MSGVGNGAGEPGEPGSLATVIDARPAPGSSPSRTKENHAIPFRIRSDQRGSGWAWGVVLRTRPRMNCRSLVSNRLRQCCFQIAMR
jgi:hypothetical protein